MNTHEAFIQAVAAAAASRVSAKEQETIKGIKLVYGAGQSGLRGVTYYNRWSKGTPGTPIASAPFVEVCAFGQENWVQVAGTTIHELAHVLTQGHGHDKDWKVACDRLGLRTAKAAGHRYLLANFAPDLRMTIAGLPRPDDGEPVGNLAGLGGLVGGAFKLRPCQMGIGTRGGRSRGKGSGSRLRLWECDCSVKVRVASDDFGATCDCCNASFHFVK